MFGDILAIYSIFNFLAKEWLSSHSDAPRILKSSIALMKYEIKKGLYNSNYELLLVECTLISNLFSLCD